MKEGGYVDPEVKAELREIEKRLSGNLQTLVTSAIAAGFKDVKDVITELFNKDIGFIREWQGTFKDHHKIHFAETIKLRGEITGARDSLSKEIDRKLQPVVDKLENLGGRQIKDEVVVETTEKIQATTDRKSELSMGKIALIVSIGTIFGGIIGYFL